MDGAWWRSQCAPILFVLLAALAAPSLAASPCTTKELGPLELEESVMRVIEDVARYTVRIETEDGLGSGTIIDPDGYVLTSAHVVDGCDRVTVTLSDGRRFRGRLKGMNTAGDLALIKIPVDGLAAARLDREGRVRRGQWVIASGHPVTAVDDAQPTVSIGVVRRLDGVVRANRGKLFHDVIVTDAPLSAGSSGGGLYDLDGRLIGVNAAVTRSEKLAFTVKIAEFLEDESRLRRGVHFDRASQPQERDDSADIDMPMPSRGVYFEREFRELRGKVDGRLIRIRNGRSSGGVIVSRDGMVLTAARNVGDLAPGDSVEVEILDGSQCVAEVVGFDLENNLALLRLEPRAGGYEAFDLDQSSPPRRGQVALVVGFDGMEGGIVSAPHRNPPSEMAAIYYPDVIQVDLRLERWQTGGGVVDRWGRLLGIVHQHRLTPPRGHGEPYGAFVLATRYLRQSLDNLRNGGGRERAPVGSIGVDLVDLEEQERAARDLAEGVLVAEVPLDSPAWDAGLRNGDVVLAIDGHPVSTRGEAVRRIAANPIGAELELLVRRADSERSVRVEVRAAAGRI